MICLLILLVIICLLHVKIHKRFDENFLCKSNTTGIKGLFVILVFIAHVLQYIVLQDNMADKLLDFCMGVLGQNIVVVFLLYSGFGIGEAIKSKGHAYISTIPYNRILKTWINFLGALVLYWILDLCILHGGYGTKEYLLSIFAWESIGNSTWFVFGILICWGATWLSFVLLHDRRKAYICLCILLIIYILVIKNLKNGHAWYDTILCYPLGMAVSFGKARVDRILTSNLKTGIIVLLSSFWIVIRLFVPQNIVVRELQSILFAVFVLTVVSRITVNNKILQWFGTHTFSIYILQRIPMNLLAFWGINSSFRWGYILMCLSITCVLAYVFDKIIFDLDKKLCKGKSR